MLGGPGSREGPLLPSRRGARETRARQTLQLRLLGIGLAIVLALIICFSLGIDPTNGLLGGRGGRGALARAGGRGGGAGRGREEDLPPTAEQRDFADEPAMDAEIAAAVAAAAAAATAAEEAAWAAVLDPDARGLGAAGHAHLSSAIDSVALSDGIERLLPPARGRRGVRDRRLRNLRGPRECRQRLGRNWAAEPVWVYLGPTHAPPSSEPVEIPGRWDRRARGFSACPTPCLSVPNTHRELADVVVTLRTRHDTPPTARPTKCPAIKTALFEAVPDAESADLARANQFARGGAPLEIYPLGARSAPGLEKYASPAALFGEYDFIAAARRDADIPLLPASWRTHELLRVPLEAERTAAEAAVAFFGLCAELGEGPEGPARRAYLLALIDASLSVHVESSCPDHASKRRLAGGDEATLTQKIALMSQHRFVLVFETRREADSVGEDFYAALVAGAVPVHLGTDQVGTFAPGNSSYIRAGDFGTAAELAAHLQRLSQEPAAYSKHLAWKQRGTSRAFRRLLRATSDTPALCRLCGQVRGLLRAELDLQRRPLNTTFLEDPIDFTEDGRPMVERERAEVPPEQMIL